ncbi:hypothetical protein CLU79DRAFT_728952 [Phycomyces nitens]|nr:hypothetical protein CLU79DRAFT_728952 [Phycomyces nitens]
MKEEVKINVSIKSVPAIHQGKIVWQASVSGLLIQCIIEDQLLGQELLKQNIPIGTHACLGGTFISLGDNMAESLNLLVTCFKIYTLSSQSLGSSKTGQKRQLSPCSDTEDEELILDSNDHSKSIEQTEKRRRVQTGPSMRWSLDKFSEYPSSVSNYFLSLFGRITLLKRYQLIDCDGANMLLNSMHAIHCNENKQNKEAMEFADMARRLTNMLNDCERNNQLPKYPFDDSICPLPSDIYRLLSG